MEEKRRDALLTAAKRLVAGSVSDQDIVASLQELGLSEEEAGILLREAKSETRPPTIPELPKKDSAEKELWKESIDRKIKEEKMKYIAGKQPESAGETAPEEEFPKHFIAKGTGEEFIPVLKKGGRAKVSEIIVESKIATTPKRRFDATADSDNALIEKMEEIEEKLDEIEEEIGGSKGKATKKAGKKRGTGKKAWARPGRKSNTGQAKNLGKPALKTWENTKAKGTENAAGKKTGEARAQGK